MSVVTAAKGYDSENNHLFVREELHAFSIITARYEHVPIWRTRGKYRKQMKHGYSKLLYNQQYKDETIKSVIKRLFGDYLMSRLTRTQNRELSFRCILILMMFSTKPIDIVFPIAQASTMMSLKLLYKSTTHRRWMKGTKYSNVVA